MANNATATAGSVVVARPRYVDDDVVVVCPPLLELGILVLGAYYYTQNRPTTWLTSSCHFSTSPNVGINTRGYKNDEQRSPGSS